MISQEYESFKRQVKDASDIVSVVSGYMPLQGKGRNMWACCPFHQEKTPSFSVNPDGQYFKCFGCGKGGDVFSFVMAMERMDFPEALQLLAERAHIPVPERRGGRSPEEARLWEEGKNLLYRLNEFAAKFFQGQLEADGGRVAREYLERRGISAESIAQYRLGYAPDSWDSLCTELRRRQAQERHIVAAGLALERKSESGIYDRFRNRVIFPIQDHSGRVVGFGARALSDADNPKYLNSPETPIFSKGQMVFGLYQARQAVEGHRRVLVMEGYTDVIMAAQKGFPTAVATLGTALGAAHLRLLRRFADQVLLVYDSDKAGLAAAERSLDIFFEVELPARIVTLAPGLDPCDFLIEHGPESFAERLDASIDLFDFKLATVRAQHDLSSAHGRAAAVKSLVDTVQRATDPIMAAELRRRAAEAFGLPEEALQAELAGRVRPVRRDRPDQPEGSDRPDQPGLSRRGRAERELVQALLACPSALPRVAEAGELSDPGAAEILAVAARMHADLGELNLEELATRLSRQESVELLAGLAAGPTSPRGPAGAGAASFDPEAAVDRVFLDLRRIALEERLAALLEEKRSAAPERQEVIVQEIIGLKRELEAMRRRPEPAIHRQDSTPEGESLATQP
ncbi:MAG TPA: DNA primase [Planctomycetota bacterium]|nr:DNA primase [Planctomycetota bacterium]